MKKMIFRRLILAVGLVMMSILLTNMYFQMSAAKRNLVNRVATMVSQVEVILERNQESYSGMTGTMKENCLQIRKL